MINVMDFKWIIFIALIVLGLIIFIWSQRHRFYAWIFSFRNHRQLGEPCPTDIIIDRDGYSLGFSQDKKTALWVAYIISKNSIGIDIDRGDRFYPDPEIPKKYRLRPEDFTHTGYDRGHLAPSSAIDFSRRSNDQTFAMSNIVLQDPKLNRQAWKSLERIIQEWTYTKGKLGIITGPLYTQRPRRVNNIAIPKRFYKVVYAFKHKKCIGFILPNKEVAAEDLWRYALSVHALEQHTGYRFLTHLTQAERRIKKQLDLAWWQSS
ncbi:MAG: DNA/RNA non-specific endonuclease [Pseudomonadota bacterium]|nr:DNA/RNA non-specific endonuclease [Pseudomonadota bacterium]